MPLVAQLAALLAAAIHVWFFILESVLFARPTVAARFGLRTPEQIAAVRPMAFNQGFYNLFLAIGTFGGLALVWMGYSRAGMTLVIWNCLSMLGAAIVLAASAPQLRRGALIQGAPPLLFLLLALT